MFNSVFGFLFGPYVVMEQVGYGQYINSRVKRFWVRSQAEAYASDAAQNTNGNVMVLNASRQVLAEFRNGERWKSIKKKILRRRTA